MVSCTPTGNQRSRGAALGNARWTSGMISHGVAFRLCAETDALLNLMRQQTPFGSADCTVLPPDARTFALESSESGARYLVRMENELLASDETLDSALIELGGHLMIHVAEYAHEYVFVHAGAVAWHDRALLLPGASCAGKSTLVAELVRAGATYYSDEFALIDERGFVHPFPRDLRMRAPGKPDQTPIPLAHLNGRAATRALPVAMVVFTEYAKDAMWAPEAVTPGRATLELLLHATPVQRTPSRVLATISAMMRGASAWRSKRGDAAGVVSSLLAALDHEGRLHPILNGDSAGCAS